MCRMTHLMFFLRQEEDLRSIRKRAQRTDLIENLVLSAFVSSTPQIRADAKGISIRCNSEQLVPMVLSN